MSTSGLVHIAAVLQLLNGLPFVTYDGDVPDDADAPYAVLYGGQGLRSRTTLATISDHLDCPFQTTAVGAGREQATWVADHVRAALLDQRPTVAGRSTSPIRHVASQPARPDRTRRPPVFIATDQYAYASVPA